MPTSVISNTITDIDGTPMAGIEAIIECIPGPAFRLNDGSEIASRIAVLTNGSGIWSATLEESSNITPAGTYYRVTERIPKESGGYKRWYFNVPAADQNLFTVLTSPNNVAGFLTPQVVTSSTRPASPFPGMMIFETDTGKVLFYYGSTLGWLPNWGTEWGEVSRAFINNTDFSTSSTSLVDVTGLNALTFNKVNGRRYLAVARLAAEHTTAATTYTAVITDGSNTILAQRTYNTNQTASAVPFEFSARSPGNESGSFTYKVRISTLSGSAVAFVRSTSPVISEIVVYDIGPAAAPVIT